jgi:signal transduction histidine kinase
LRGRIESEAALEERHRIAREFHDSLEQDLAGLGLRLDAVATRAIDDKGRALIAGSRGLVSRIQAETRNLVSDLRDPAETAGDLAGVLRAVADEHVDKERITLSVKLPLAPPPLLAATVVHHLRMIARESVTNALKHGGSTLVTLALQVKENALVLSIADNGMGFDPALADRGKAGHFGCVGIRERARRIGAAVVWRSAPGAGVTVELTLPLGGKTRETAL